MVGVLTAPPLPRRLRPAGLPRIGCWLCLTTKSCSSHKTISPYSSPRAPLPLFSPSNHPLLGLLGLGAVTPLSNPNPGSTELWVFLFLLSIPLSLVLFKNSPQCIQVACIVSYLLGPKLIKHIHIFSKKKNLGKLMRDGGGRIRGTGLVSGSTAGVLGGTVLCGGAILGRAGTPQRPRPGLCSLDRCQ